MNDSLPSPFLFIFALHIHLGRKNHVKWIGKRVGVGLNHGWICPRNQDSYPTLIDPLCWIWIWYQIKHLKIQFQPLIQEEKKGS